MHHRTTRAFVAAAALALTLGACMDAPTSPAAARIAGTGQPGRTASSTSDVTLIPNTVKYRDNGGKPARGRAGTAELEALALLAKDGTVIVESRARSIDPAVTDQGEISKLQIKASAADGTPRFVRNLHGESSDEPLELRGLSRGDRVQLQAHVRGLDGNRTNVVTVTETVKRRADLGIRISTPERARVGAQVIIWATVTEHNGDMGSRADCELLIDGQPADRAGGIWVDAGDAVTCGFAHVFAQPGTYAFTVRALPPEGGDWDEANNVDAGVVEVDPYLGDNRFRAHVSVGEYTYYDSTTYTYAWRNPMDGTATEGISRFLVRDEQRSTSMYAWLPRAIAGPVRVELSQESGGQVLHSAAFVDEGTGYDWCVESYDGPASLYVCSASYGGLDGAYTDISYHLWGPGGGAVYHSDQYSRVWDELTGEEIAVYHMVDTSGYWTPMTPSLGETYTWRVRVVAADGEYVAEETRPIARERIDRSIPYNCWELTDFYQLGTMCQTTYSYSEGAYGY
jgi:hypothetical protein